MKFKKFLIFICLIICLFSIASVCASDINETIVTNEDQDTIEINENQDIITENSSVGTFSELSDKINNGSGGDYKIILEKNYIYDSNIDVEYKNGIKIPNYKYNSISIDGNGHIIDGSGKAKIFDVYARNVVLKNIIFKNIYSSSANTQGAIFGSSLSTTIENCSFIDINVKYGTSAITWHGPNLNINNCSFINNVADYTIQLFGTYANINNCTFINNSAVNDILDFTMFGDFGYLKNSIFINNSVDSKGSIVNCYGDESIISNCTFINPSAGGNPIYCRGNQ